MRHFRLRDRLKAPSLALLALALAAGSVTDRARATSCARPLTIPLRIVSVTEDGVPVSAPGYDADVTIFGRESGVFLQAFPHDRHAVWRETYSVADAPAP